MGREKSDFDGTDRLLTLVMLAPPLIWLSHLGLSYVWTPTACATGDWTRLHLFSAVAVVITILSGLMAWRSLQRFGAGGINEGDARLTRRRFMAIAGVVFTITFTLLILANEVPNIMLRSCS